MKHRGSARRRKGGGWRSDHAEYVCMDGRRIVLSSWMQPHRRLVVHCCQWESFPGPARTMHYDANSSTSDAGRELFQFRVDSDESVDSVVLPVGPERSCLTPDSTVFVSGTEMSRDMGEITKCGEGTRTIVFPSSVRKIHWEAFNSRKRLASVVMNKDLEDLPGQYYPVYEDSVSYGDVYEFHTPFAGSSVREVQVSPGLGGLDDRVFYNTPTLRTVHLPEGLETIGEECFYLCGITELVVPASVTQIQNRAFANTKLEKITFQEGSSLESIGNGCFYGSALQEFVAPLSLRYIGAEAFSKCECLTYVELNEGLEELQGRVKRNILKRSQCILGLFEHSVLESIRLPQTLKTLGIGAFKNCPHLKTVELPAGLEEIGDECFSCRIERLCVPASVQRIGEKAFSGCGQLRVIEFEANSLLVEAKRGAFEGCDGVTFRINPGMQFDIEAHTDAKIRRVPPAAMIGDTTLNDSEASKAW